MPRSIRPMHLMAFLACLCWLTQPLPVLAEAAAELRFGELFAQPVGPRGLAPSAKLLSLNGRAVRMLGYMAAAEQPTAGVLVLIPLPASLGDEDEHLADDLPAHAVFVHLSGPAATRPVPNHAGLIRLQGQLSVGPRDEADGHVSTVRLLLDAEQSAALLRLAPPVP